MSNIIHYCDACGLRIPPADYDSGAAGNNASGKLLCATCLAREAPAPAAASTSNRRRPVATSPQPAPEHTAPARAKVAKAARTAGRFPIELAAGAILIVGIGAVALVLSQRKSADVPAVAAARIEDTLKKAEPPPARNISTPQPAPVSAPARPGPATLSVPAPAPGLSVVVPPPERKIEDVGFDPRASFAANQLEQAKSFIKANPEEVFTYRDQLERLRDNYKSTAAGKEAAQLLSELKLPEVDPAINPPPTPDDAWAKAVQVLPASDPSKDSIKGRWSKYNDALRSDQEMWSTLTLPYLLPDEYDARITFTRLEKDDCLLVNLAHHGRAIIFSIGGAGNTGCSLEDIQPKRKYMLSPKLVRPGVLASNQRTQVVVQVREKCVRVYLNGKLTLGCLMDDAVVTHHPDLSPAKQNQMGLLTWASVYEIHSIEILEIKGKGEFLREPPK
jgi:hypothetical protein